jgi:hypothetical protein
VSRQQRRALGDRRRRPAAVPLPGRPRLVARVAPHPPERVLEAALWIALRSLEERAALARRLAEPARRRGHRITAARFEEQATEAQQAARVVRDLLLGRDSFAAAWPLVSDRQAPAVTPASEERGG